MSCINENDITNLSKSELKEKCKKLDIKNYKSKNKEELIELIKTNTQDNALKKPNLHLHPHQYI